MADTIQLRDLRKPSTAPDTINLSDLQASAKAGGVLRQIPRQVGLTARYGIEALGNNAQIVTEPIRYLQDKLTPDRAPTMSQLVTGERTPKSLPLGMIASQFADGLGLPSPQGADERVVADATRLMAGAGTFAGASQLASRVPGVAGKVFNMLASNPLQQLTAAAGGGLAGGSVREAGGGAVEQIGATVLGTVLGGMAPAGANSVITKLKELRASPMQLEGKITLALKEGGVDYSQLPKAVRDALVRDVRQATNMGGEINPEALRRLADFRATNTTPTRGMVSLDPVQLTREKNLAKIGANSADDGLQGLARLQNENNGQLVRNLNTMGAADGDAFAAGQTSIGRITQTDATKAKAVGDLYRAARDMPGGDTPLDTAQLVQNMYAELAKSGKSAFLPDDIAKLMNEIQAGQTVINGVKLPTQFDAQSLDNLMTAIATKQRGTSDGNIKAALSAIRTAIDKTPVNPTKTPFGGNQVVTQQGADFLRGQDAQAGAFMDALNKARGAAKSRFDWQESARPIEAALGGAAPDKFIQQFVIGGTVKDAQNLAMSGDRGAIKNAILAHLKSQAVSGAADEVANFSQSAFNKALRQVGDRKLQLFFTPDEINALQANGRVASYMQVQPAGSAVNNSNTAGAAMGRALDVLPTWMRNAPLVKPMVLDPLRSMEISMSQQRAQNVIPGLLKPQQATPSPMLLGPSVALGGLLAAPSVERP